MYQIIVPSDREYMQGGTHEKQIPKFISPFEVEWPLGNSKVEILDWSNTETLKGKQEILYFCGEYIQKI
ncbi:hypothetical protein FFA43_01435 [Campylobacter hyointestinalis subsp. hyointestinalis]|nr:hypothetical protein [Campylobacter hyointestinalis]PPB57562.1 hypothetical protein CDQ71_06730 [Campylobacter hyointestinalis subsp. hyointestinalis]QCT99378.1 hypothetical protein FFA43_01435 [Campylobacter hyointestinalis subsp. hyointestinalis]